MRRVSSRLAVFAVLAVSVLGLSAVGATAKTAPAPTKHKGKYVLITGGSTMVTVTNATATFLTNHGVSVTVVAPATQSGLSVTLPVKGGVGRVKRNIDGVILHTGAVTFATSTKKATVRHITLVKIGHLAHLAGTVDGKVVVLATVRHFKVSSSGTTASLSGELHLSAQVAHIVNKLVGKHVVSRGYDFGSFTSSLTIK